MNLRVDKSVVIGWPWFGIGVVRLHVTESSWYTIAMLFITTRFGFGVHIGGLTKTVQARVEP